MATSDQSNSQGKMINGMMANPWQGDTGGMAAYQPDPNTGGYSGMYYDGGGMVAPTDMPPVAGTQSDAGGNVDMPPVAGPTSDTGPMATWNPNATPSVVPPPTTSVPFDNPNAPPPIPVGSSMPQNPPVNPSDPNSPPVGGGGGNPGGSGGSGTTTGTSGGGSTTMTSVAPVAPIADPGRSPEEQALIDQLMQRMQQGTDIDPNNPVIRNQTDAYSAQQERARRNYLADQAEANGPYSQGQQAGLARMTAETMGQNVGQFQANLIGKELTARRDEIQNALTQMGSTLTTEQQQGLQRDIANLNAAIEQSKTTTQNSQFYAGLNQQDKQFVDQLQQNEKFKNMDDALSRYNTTTQNAQFFAQLAQNKDIAGMQNALDKSKLDEQSKEFLLQLAQTGDYQKAEEAYKTAALSQDQNQFLAKLAQTGDLAQMDDIFRRMQLAQNESQFLDQLGFNTTQQQNYWDWIQRGNPPPTGA